MTKEKIEKKIEILNRQGLDVVRWIENPEESMFTQETLLRLKKSIWYELTQLKLKLKSKNYDDEGKRKGSFT